MTPLPPMSKNPEAIELIADIEREVNGPPGSADGRRQLLRRALAALQSSSDVVEIAEGAACICKIDCPMTEDGHWINCPAHFCHANYLAMINHSPASNEAYGLAIAAAALVTATDEQEALRPQRQAVLDELRWLSASSASQAVDPWREAVIEALVVNHIYRAEHDADPRLALNELVCWEQSVALDPAVSQAARDLVASSAPIAEGRAETSQQTAETPAAIRSLDQAVEHVRSRNAKGWFGPNIGHSLDVLLAALNVPSDAVSQSQMVDLEALVAACEEEFTSELTETDGDPDEGPWRDDDDEAVAHGLADDGNTIVPGAITFGHIRRARAALASLRVNEVGK